MKLLITLILILVAFNTYSTYEATQAMKSRNASLEQQVRRQQKQIRDLRFEVDTAAEAARLMANQFNHAQDLLDNTLDKLESEPWNTRKTTMRKLKKVEIPLVAVDEDEPTVAGINQ